MDSAGLQLLLAAKKTAQQGGYPLHLIMHSHAVLDALELCQLTAFFGDPTLMPHADHA
jgi:anti-anti-sigma regulatory factor